VSDGTTSTTASWRAWWPDALVAAGVVVVGAVEVSERTALRVDGTVLLAWNVLVPVAVAAGLARRAPGLALALVWLVGVGQLLSGAPLLATQAAVLVVAFGTARWGSVATAAVGGASVPVGVGVAALAVTTGTYPRGQADVELLSDLLDVVSRLGGVGVVGAVVLPLAVLGAAWLAGLALRFLDRATTSRAQQAAAEEAEAVARVETEQALEIARLRSDQSRLARDVHDVVGHSLAVILAQAESAQYLPDEDPARLKEVLATIAGSARASLTDVRHVLADPGATTRPVRVDELEQLVEGARGTGYALEPVVTGTPRPLPPELAAVAYRVLQEMLTNALRHGRRDAPVRVEQRWPDSSERELVLQVQNATTSPPADRGSGRGLPGMRRRLESVGGHLSVVDDAGGGTFTATARMPVRA
jgi:signal transduction histidine kinase